MPGRLWAIFCFRVRFVSLRVGLQQPRECGMRKLIDAAALSSLIGSVYQRGGEPERSPETRRLGRSEVDFAGASLSVMALPSGNGLLESRSSSEFGAIERT